MRLWYIVTCMLCYVMLCHIVHGCFTRAGEHVLCVYKYPLCYMYIFCREMIELRERTMRRWYKQDHPSAQHVEEKFTDTHFSYLPHSFRFST